MRGLVEVQGGDGAAIQRAIDEAERWCGVAQIPAGEFHCAAPLVIHSPMTLRGLGMHATRLVKCYSGPALSILSDDIRVEALDLFGDSRPGDGIEVGAADATNGAYSVGLRDALVERHGGNGINVINGNGGRMDCVRCFANGGNGILLRSQQTTGAANANAWHLTQTVAMGNMGDGIHVETPAHWLVGVVGEGNNGCGIYVNAPHSTVYGYVEGNLGHPVHFGPSCYHYHAAIHLAQGQPKIENGWGFFQALDGNPFQPGWTWDGKLYLRNGPPIVEGGS